MGNSLKSATLLDCDTETKLSQKRKKLSLAHHQRKNNTSRDSQGKHEASNATQGALYRECKSGIAEAPLDQLVSFSSVSDNIESSQEDDYGDFASLDYENGTIHEVRESELNIEAESRDETDTEDDYCAIFGHRRIILRPPFHNCVNPPFLDHKDDVLYENSEERTMQVGDNLINAYQREHQCKPSINDDVLRKITSLNPTSIAASFGSLTSISNANLFEYTDEEIMMENGEAPTPDSNLRPQIINHVGSQVGSQVEKIKCRSFHIITTAALPWMTGTAVNPLLRAAYLNKLNRSAVETLDCGNKYKMMKKVTLYVPWLTKASDRKTVYGEKYSFESPEDQEKYIRKWLAESAAMPQEACILSHGIHICFYDAYYSTFFMSIFPSGSVEDLIEEDKADVCILEEPEHLNCVRTSHNKSWTKKFRHVIGIMHTNYTAYTSAHLSGVITTPIIFLLNRLLARVHCHRIIKLSSTLQIYAPEKEIITNVHGIRSEFFAQGMKKAERSSYDSEKELSMIDFDRGVYFIGKLLWAKGLDQMISLQQFFRKSTGDFFRIDIYGNGPEEEEIKRSFLGGNCSNCSLAINEEKETVDSVKRSVQTDVSKPTLKLKRHVIPAQFLGRKDHASLGGKYHVFVNPSITEVLCTTTAEALAMGMFVVIPAHPSNNFFEKFSNCLMYNNKIEFVSQLQYAMKNEPKPISTELDVLSWEAATDRLLDAAAISVRDECRRSRLNFDRLDEKAVDALHGVVWKNWLNYLQKQSCSSTSK